MFVLKVLPIAAVLMSVGVPQPPAVRGEALDKPTEREVVSRFFKAVDEYVLARRLAAQRDPDIMCLAEGVHEAVDGLAAMPPYASRAPREGDIFSPYVADLFRERMARTLRPFEGTPLAPAATPAEPAVPVITIGEPLPKDPGRQIFAWLLATLPVLPTELEYRLIGRNLVIADVGADIAVDVLRGALPVR